MKRELFHGLSAMLLYYAIDACARALLVLPDNSLINLANFLPLLLGIVWGPSAAVALTFGALIAEYSVWLELPEIFRLHGLATCLWEALRLFCNCGFWAFVGSYLPWRLWHSILVDPDEPLFALRPKTVLKFVLIAFITTLTSALFCAMSADEAYMLRFIGHSAKFLGSMAGFVFVCFNNDFHTTLFFGLIVFVFLIGRGYPFCLPAPVREANPRRQRAFDLLFLFAVGLAICFCHPAMLGHDKLRLAAGLLLCSYFFRPLSPSSRQADARENVSREWGGMERSIAALFYGFLFLLFLVLDLSGVIYGLNDIDIWMQFNFECLMTMNVAIVAFLYMLLKYRHSIMTQFAILEIATVLISAFTLGGIAVFVVDRITSQNVENELSEMTIICRERLKRTFDGVQVSVDSFRAIAEEELESFDRIAEDGKYRAEYLKRTEELFRSIASNTDGSITFYLRCIPAFAGPQGGFSWGRAENRWEGTAPSFYRRRPIDLSQYDPSDLANVGWYYIPIARRNATWIEPYIDSMLGVYVISYVTPFYKQNRLVGVVGLDIDFDYLIHEVRRMSVYGYGHVYLTDRQGRVLYHKDYHQGEMFQSNPEFRELETYLTNGIWMGIATPKREIYAERNNLLMHLVCAMLVVAMLVSFLILLVASRRVIRPFIALTEAVQKIAGGNLEVELPAGSDTEMGILVQSIREMAGKLEVYVYRDGLTGLLNAAAYARKCAELSQRGDDGAPYAVVVFDVNFLKKMNDAYGHEAGNELLRCAAGVMEKVFGRDSVYRIGGDEFAAILEGADYERREGMVDGFDMATAAKRFRVQDMEFELSVARGLAVWRSGEDYAVIFQEADAAMYAHKAEIKAKLGENTR